MEYDLKIEEWNNLRLHLVDEGYTIYKNFGENEFTIEKKGTLFENPEFAAKYIFKNRKNSLGKLVTQDSKLEGVVDNFYKKD